MHAFEQARRLVLIAFLLLNAASAFAQTGVPATDEDPSSSTQHEGQPHESTAPSDPPPVALTPSAPAPEPVSGDRTANDDTADHARLELAILRAQVERGRYGNGRPLTLVIAATAAAQILATVAVDFGMELKDMKRDIDRDYYTESYDFNDDGVVDRSDLKFVRRLTAGLATLSVAHVGLAAFGIWWLRKRVSARHRIDDELRRLDPERTRLQLTFDVGASSDGAVGQLVGRF